MSCPMLTRLFSLFLMMALVASPLYSQKGKLRQANKLFEDLKYQDAIKAYRDVLKKGNFPEAKINLAESYRKTNKWEQAEKWYAVVVKLEEASPEHYLYYGQILQANGKYPEAKEWYEKYSKLVPDDIRGKYLIMSCDDKVQVGLRTPNPIYKVIPVPELNSRFDDFSPTLQSDKFIVFTSDRPGGKDKGRSYSWTGNSFLGLYGCERKIEGKSVGHGRAKPFAPAVGTKYHDGPACFSPDRKTLFTTRNNLTPKGKKKKNAEVLIRLKIYSVSVDEKGTPTDKIIELPFCSDDYDVCHPAISHDGKYLYFVSNMPGGNGGHDIYRAQNLGKGQWGAPENLGKEVNSEGNDVFPYVHEDGSVYFSTQSRAGLGGMDIFVTQPSEDGKSWQEPQNLGTPLNSEMDDFGFSISSDKSFGYFNSQRKGGKGGDDIYMFQYEAVNVELYVFDKKTKQPIKNAKISAQCFRGKELETNEKGLTFITLGPETMCQFILNTPGYAVTGKSINTGRKSGDKPLRVEIPLRKDLFFSATGRVVDGDAKTRIQGCKVTLSNDCNKSEQEVTSDELGEWKFNLDEECCYTVTMRKDSFLIRTEKICTKGEADSKNFSLVSLLERVVLPATPIVISPPMPKPTDSKSQKGNNEEPPNTIADNKAPKNKKKGKKAAKIAVVQETSVEVSGFKDIILENIYYDYNSSELREEASDDLKKILKLMKDNPALIVEIGSHTDARGSNAYNLKLSDRRARAVVAWLKKNAIPTNKLKPAGYGEEKPVNDCLNNINCSEEEHQRNRRTVFRIVGIINGVDYTNGLESVEPENIQTDPCKGCPFNP